MPIPRRLLGLLVPLGLIALPACGAGPLLPLRDSDHDRLLESVRQTPVIKKKLEFGVLPAAPGESFPLHPNTVATDPAPNTISIGKSDAVVTAPPESVKENAENLATIPTPPPSSPLVRAVQAFLDGKPDTALDHLAGYDKPNQELLLQLMPAVVQVSDMPLTPPDPDESVKLARVFESVAATLTRRTGMTVKKAVLCRRVEGFGRYSQVRDRNAIIRDDLYDLYVEVGNVPCEPFTRQDGAEGFQTRLDVAMQVTDDTGRVIEIYDPKTGQAGPKSTSEKREFSYSPIHDYYVVARVQAPGRPGQYTVTIELRDPKTGRVVSRPVPFKVQ